MSFQSIAIDGPAGAGKSTVARAAAKELNFLYVDTGAIYRTVALAVDRLGIDPGEGEAVARALPALKIRMDHSSAGEQRMFLGEEDVSKAIRENRVSALASKVSALPQVRAFLLDFQRQLARENNVIMDGRDIGTVVLPRAEVKVFLTAAPEARARRRLLELELRGQQADYDTILKEIVQRDKQDRERAAAPLKQAEDAVLLDTTQLNLEQSVEALLKIVRARLNP